MKRLIFGADTEQIQMMKYPQRFASIVVAILVSHTAAVTCPVTDGWRVRLNGEHGDDELKNLSLSI
jgi:hypothetical protein